MRKWIGVGVMLLLALGGAGWAVLGPSTPNPVVRGKPLSRWVTELDSTVGGAEIKPAEACAAVREAGALGIPRYLALLESRNSILNNDWIAWGLRRAPLLDRAARRLGYRGYNQQRWQGLWGFKALGTNGAPAIPELVALLQRHAHGERSGPARAAAFALGYLGPAGVGALTHALASEDPAVREHAARGLYSADTNALPALEHLARALQDPVPAVRRAAAEPLFVLGNRLRPAPSGTASAELARIEAAFISALRDGDAVLRRFSAWALAESPSPAAARALREAMNDPDAEVRSFAAKSLATVERSLGTQASGSR